MQAKASGLCRGSGKVFVRLKIEGIGSEQAVAIETEAPNGCRVPSSVFEVPEIELNRKGQRFFVAIFPILGFPNCHSNLRTLDESGKVQASCTFDLNFSRAKWESRLNYRIQKDLCEQIRDFDRIDRFESASMEFWECFIDGDELIIRGMVREPYREDSNISVTCLDAKLNPIEIHPFILGDRKASVAGSLDKEFREIQFSIRIPDKIQRLIFVIEDTANPSLSSFEVLDGPMLEDLRDKTSKLVMNAQVDPDYEFWFKNNKADIDELARESNVSFESAPRFSLIVPLFKTPTNLFKEMLASVKAQSYAAWELVLVNGSPDEKSLSDAVAAAIESDKRVRAVTLEANLGISENTNRGIEVATGEFICFFDHDDVLEPNVLFEYAVAVNANPKTDVLYCDEDKLLPNGEHIQPFFKPDFNLEFLRNNNYICHLLCIRKSLLETLEPNRPEFDGAQDHNMILEAVEKARHVHHVPQVLYHWRMTENSTSANAESKSYATDAGIRAVKAHLKRLGIAATVTPSRRPFTYRVIYDIPKKHPLVSIIIPSKDHADVLETCLSSIIKKTTYDNYEIVVLENNSTDPETFDYYERIQADHPGIIHVETWPYEFNYSKLQNFGAEKTRGDYLILLNNDTEVITPEWIETMLGICSQDDVGIVGVRLLYKDDTVQHAGIAIGCRAAICLGKNLPRNNWGYFALSDAQRELSAVTAACLMTKREVFDAVGGFTEELSVAFNDIDYCLKVREMGKKVLYTPEVELYHYESLSRGIEDDIKKKLRYHREISYLNYRWARYYVEGDPYFTPNVAKSDPASWYYHL